MKSKLCLLAPIMLLSCVLTSGTVSGDAATVWETYIKPMFTGVSITAVVSCIFSVVMAILNRKNNIKSKTSVLDMAATALNVIKTNNECIKQIMELKELNDESLKTFVKQTDKIIEEVATVTNQTELLAKLKEAQQRTIEALTKMAANTKELVVSGVANELEQINNEIKEIK